MQVMQCAIPRCNAKHRRQTTFFESSEATCSSVPVVMEFLLCPCENVTRRPRPAPGMPDPASASVSARDSRVAEPRGREKKKEKVPTHPSSRFPHFHMILTTRRER